MQRRLEIQEWEKVGINNDTSRVLNSAQKGQCCPQPKYQCDVLQQPASNPNVLTFKSKRCTIFDFWHQDGDDRVLTFCPGWRALTSNTQPPSVQCISTASCQFLRASPAPKTAWRSPKLTWFARRIFSDVLVPNFVEVSAVAARAPPRACFRLDES